MNLILNPNSKAPILKPRSFNYAPESQFVWPPLRKFKHYMHATIYQCVYFGLLQSHWKNLTTNGTEHTYIKTPQTLV